MGRKSNGGGGYQALGGGEALFAFTNHNSTEFQVSGNGTVTAGIWHGTAIDLGNFSAGNLPVANLNSGTNANTGTVYRGDGTWANVVTGNLSSNGFIATASGNFFNFIGLNVTSGNLEFQVGNLTGTTYLTIPAAYLTNHR